MLVVESRVLKPALNTQVLKVFEVVFDAHVVENAAQSPEGNGHAVGATEAAKLSASLKMWFQVKNDPGNATLLESTF